MADEDDVARLHQDETDMIGTDLQGGSFTGMNLSGRDFSKARLERVQFLDCDLSGCDFRSAGLANASFAGSRMQGAKLDGALFRINFSGTSLQGATISALMTSCTFKNADLRGTNFAGSRLSEVGTSFEDAQFDEFTNFDGVEALRQYSRDPIFQNYGFAKGRFHRRNAGPAPSAVRDPRAETVPEDEASYLVTEGGDHLTTESGDHLVVEQASPTSRPEHLSFDLYEPFVVRDIQDAAAAAKDRLGRLIDETIEEITVAEPPGSNYPPPEILINEDERRQMFEALDLASRLQPSDKTNREVLLSAGKRIIKAAAQIASWVGAKLDRAADSFADAAGTAGAKFTMYYVAYQLISGQLFTLSDALLKALGGG
mgnify:CR=1 FL=1|tara:strand:- start:637 stop:1749 length:1113 start_codon:yes stop_codon:yes gene_type:complete